MFPLQYYMYKYIRLSRKVGSAVMLLMETDFDELYTQYVLGHLYVQTLNVKGIN